MFAVIYRWRLKSGMEGQFADGWDRVTRAIHQSCGSYGSRLHRCDDGMWLAYARWPDETAQQDCEHWERRAAPDAGGRGGTRGDHPMRGRGGPP